MLEGAARSLDGAWILTLTNLHEYRRGQILLVVGEMALVRWHRDAGSEAILEPLAALAGCRVFFVYDEWARECRHKARESRQLAAVVESETHADARLESAQAQR